MFFREFKIISIVVLNILSHENCNVTLNLRKNLLLLHNRLNIFLFEQTQKTFFSNRYYSRTVTTRIDMHRNRYFHNTYLLFLYEYRND